ncbi:unnamed protein product [Phytophthora fragariaefolia]|uniref:Unnamed protein product n=1 Tax=Phytophthora fragariaefolia TaxID=1490495 RepID=A0A9W7CIU2_9STRA|nr:unnamed protein product [Phytophthora fragariaefolia]
MDQAEGADHAARAYELAMAEEEAKMEAAVAKQAEADSRKRRTKKRLKSMGQTARQHAAAKETRADALRSEEDGLHQRAAALERLEQRAQNRASGKAARKSKRASLSPDKSEVDHDNSEGDDDSSSYARPSLSTISTEPTGRKPDVNIVPAEELRASRYTALDSGDERVHGVDAFDCSEELWCDDAGAVGSADESSEDDEQETVSRFPTAR